MEEEVEINGEETSLVVSSPFKEKVKKILKKIEGFFVDLKEKEEKAKLGEYKKLKYVFKREDGTFVAIDRKEKINVQDINLEKLYIYESNKNTLDKNEYKMHTEVYANIDYKKLKKNKSYRYVLINELLDTERLNNKVINEYNKYLGEVVYNENTKIYSKNVDKNILNIVKNNLKDNSENMELKDMK